MKNLKTILGIALLSSTVMMAQNQETNTVDHEETVTVEKKAVMKDGKMVEGKVKTIKRKETPVTFERRTGKLNREKNPSKVTETVMIDNDWDPFYDKKMETTYYSYNNMYYNFKPDSKGFVMSTKKNDKVYLRNGRAMRIDNMNNYYVTTKDYSGIGYFNEEGNFVVRYYDEKSDDMIEIEYMTSK